MNIKFKELLLFIIVKTHIGNTAKLKDDICYYYSQLELKDIYEDDVET